jgi:outer membrane lipoprotein-sorting protein
MKNLILGLLAVFTALSVSAQYDPKALEILEAMSKKYKSIPAFEANITCNLSNDVDKVNDEFKGKITVKGDKFRMVLPEQEVINNGATIWTYLPEAKEVNIDNYDPTRKISTLRKSTKSIRRDINTSTCRTRLRVV